MRNIKVSATVLGSLSNIPTAVLRSVLPLRLGTAVLFFYFFFSEHKSQEKIFTFDHLEDRNTSTGNIDS